MALGFPYFRKYSQPGKPFGALRRPDSPGLKPPGRPAPMGRPGAVSRPNAAHKSLSAPSGVKSSQRLASLTGVSPSAAPARIGSGPHFSHVRVEPMLSRDEARPTPLADPGHQRAAGRRHGAGRQHRRAPEAGPGLAAPRVRGPRARDAGHPARERLPASPPAA